MKVGYVVLYVDAVTRAERVARGVEASEVGEHGGTLSFAFPDPEGRWFAVTQA